jgi:hypothetical protein
VLEQAQALPEPTPREKDHANKLLAEIDRHLKAPETARRLRKFKRYREAYKGWKRAPDAGSEEATGDRYRTNLIYANIAALLPQIYAKDPDFAFSPTERVAPEKYDSVKKFAKTAEIVVREELRRAELKKRAKAAVRSTMTVSLHWWKVTWQEQKGVDPIIQNRLNDAQDDIERLQMLMDKIAKGEAKSDEDLNVKKVEAEQLLQSLQGQATEKVLAKGLVIDPVRAEDLIILDDGISSFDEYVRSRKIAHQIWLQAEKFEETFGFKPTSAKTYAQQDGSSREAGSKDSSGFYRVFEVWDLMTRTVYTVAEGEQRYCRKPFSPKALGDRWYAFFGLAFNPVADEFWPLSDVELIEALCDEYNRTRDDLAKHREENLPVRLARKGGALTEEDAQRIASRKSNDIIFINGVSGRPLDDDIAVMQNPPIDVNNYDTSPIRSDVEQVLGASDATRGTVMKAKTATEAEIVAQGLRSRTEERQDTIEDVCEEVARYAFEMCLQKLSLEDVQEIAGEGAEWPADPATAEQAFGWLNLRVQAGTSGKPNRLQEQDRWLQLLPIIQEAIVKVVELRASGDEKMATAVVELVRETLRRFDERIDLDQFIPSSDREDEAIELDQMEPDQMKQIIMDLRGQLEELQKQLEELQNPLQLEAMKYDREEQRALRVEAMKQGKLALGPDGQPMPVEAPDGMSDALMQIAQRLDELDARLNQVQMEHQSLGVGGPAGAPAAPGPEARVVIDTEASLAPLSQAIADGNNAVLEAINQSNASMQQTMAQVVATMSAPKVRTVQIVAPDGQAYSGQSVEQPMQQQSPSEE